MPTTDMMNLAALVHNLRCSLLQVERSLLQVAGLDRQLGEFTNCWVRTLANFVANHGNKIRPSHTNTPHLSVFTSEYVSLNSPVAASLHSHFACRPCCELPLCIIPVCSSSTGSERPEPLASAQRGGRAGGAAQPGAACRTPGQYPVDGSTEEEAHHRSQPHQEES